MTVQSRPHDAFPLELDQQGDYRHHARFRQQSSRLFLVIGTLQHWRLATFRFGSHEIGKT